MLASHDSKGPLSLIIIDEISLEGLEGITFDGLWKRISLRLQLPLPLLQNLQNQIWNFILKAHPNLQFYELPQPREKLKLFDRRDYMDLESGFPMLPDECPFTKYKFVPIEDGNMREFCEDNKERKEIRGSCECYKERKEIDINELQEMKLNDILEKWGDKFIIVANQKLRNRALISETVPKPKDLTLIQYCTLEVIGRSRYNGETTSGRHSLQYMFKDSAIMFYVRNKLLNFKLIAKQPYNERLIGRFGSGFLLSLPRFYKEFRSRPMIVIETLYTTIKSKENGMALSQEVKEIFSSDNRTTFKKFKYMSLFRKNFEYIKVPYRTYYPDAEEREYLKRDSDEERELNIVKLKNPNATLEELLVVDEAKEETNSIEFLDGKNSYIDMPLLDQVYDMIEKSGPKGISQTNLVKDLGMTKYIVRTMLRKLAGFGVIASFLKDVGRQRTTMYVTITQSMGCSNIIPEESEGFQTLVNLAVVNPIEETQLENLETTKSVTETIEEIDTTKTKSNDDDNKNEEEIEIIINDFKYPLLGDQLNLSRLTKRQIDRINFIVAMINEHLLLDCSNIYKWLKEKEIEQGFKDQLCKKSLFRHIKWLQKRKMINAYEISFKLREYAKCYKYITHPKITQDSAIFQDELKLCKTTLCSNIYDKQYRLKTATQTQLRKEKKEKEKRKLHKLTPDKVLRVPKFLRAKYYHEFWLYLAYQQDRNSDVIELNDEILETWKTSEPELYIDDIKKNLPPLYSENISYLMFINPLPEYKEPKGWIYFEDALLRMPLSLLAKTHKFNKSAPLLENYINHPIRQHYLVDHLPIAVQEYLGQLRLSFFALDESLKLLGQMGLIQVGEKKYKDPRKVWLYINRNGVLLDTTISDPGYDKISTNKTYEELAYDFRNPINIKNYWDDLNRICFSTRLGLISFRTEQKMKCKEPLELPQPVGFYEAISKDIGYLPGDKLGAAGLHSVLYAHLRLNWSWVLKVKSASQPLSTGKKVKLPGLTTKLSAAIKERKEGKRISKVVLIHGKKVTLKRRGGVKDKLKENRIRCEYDSVDKEALKLMQSLRVSWSPKEDRMLKLCRAVLVYLNDSSITKHISCHVIRDILHWSLQSLNKTSRACQRRMIFVVRKKRDFPDTAEWAHELRQNKYINHIYGTNFIHDLRRIYPVDNQFVLALKIHFIKLVHYLIKITSNLDTTLCKDVIFPDTINQFYQFYKEAPETNLFYFDPIEIDDIQVFTILSLIHSSVCCAKDKTMFNIQLFEIYKAYREELLSKAVKLARTQQMVVNTKIKTKLKGKLLPITGSHYSLSGKYRQQLFLQIPYTVLEQSLASFDSFILTIFQNNDETFEFTSADSGLCFFFAEIIQLKNIFMNIKIPSKILTVDPNQSNLSSVSEKILDHFRQMYENAPKTEYTKYFDDKYKSSGSKQPKVKFNVINESYKLHYNPYNLLSKLSDIYIHFFCTLNHLNKIIDLKFSKLSDDKYCPFDCVLNKPNYIEIIEEIIKEKYDLIELLTKVTTSETILQDYVLVTLANLLPIFEKLQEFLKKRTKHLDRKDVGKISMKPQAVDIIDLAKKLAEYTAEDVVDFGEYEQTLNKDDKIIRAHEFFVVNLPKIAINCVKTSMDEITQYKGMDVPIDIIPNKADKNAIITKITREFVWSVPKVNAEEVTADMVAEKFSTTEQMFTLKVLEYIKNKERGAYCPELIDHFKDEIMLVKSITLLKKHSLILRVGVASFCYVYKDNVEPWTIRTYNIKRLERESLRPISEITETEGEPSAKTPKLDIPDKCLPSKRRRCEKSASDETAVVKDVIKQRETIIMRPVPWIRVNGSLNRRVFDKWIGSVLVECVAMNGQKVAKLFERFSYLYPVHILFLLEILRDLDCISLKVVQSKKNLNIFSTYELPIESDATEFSRCEDVFVITKPNAILNLSYFIGEKKYKTEFV